MSQLGILSEAYEAFFLSGFRTFHIFLGILLALGIVLFASVIRGRPKGNAILILGPTGAGKTTLFHQLQYGSTMNGTVASMEPREGAKARPVTLVDVPGHPRVRDTWLAWESTARGIVFLVDAVDFLPHKAAIAEQLYDVLTHPGVSSKRLPILLAANKADLGVKAHSVDFIRKRVEKELDQLQSTRAALEDVGGGRAVTSHLLPPGSPPFTFAVLSQLRGIQVSTASVSAQEGEGVAGVEAFVRRCVPA